MTNDPAGFLHRWESALGGAAGEARIVFNDLRVTWRKWAARHGFHGYTRADLVLILGGWLVAFLAGYAWGAGYVPW